MPTNLSSIFATAGAELHKHFGELDDTGEELSEEAITLLDVGNEDEMPLPAILSAVRYEPVYDPATGEEHKIMRRTAKVLPSEFTDYEITQLPIRFEARIGEETWVHDPTQTDWGTMFVTIGLKRDMLSRLKTQERNGGAV